MHRRAFLACQAAVPVRPFAALEEAEEHHLRLEREVAHLAEEDGPSVGDGEGALRP